jgi:hypothetical protein
MGYLDIDVRAHLPQGKDGRRATARSKGKVERPFRTVKEMHETLYHFHEPKDEEEANAWLRNFLVRYNGLQHRSEPHSRMEDWIENLPSSGVRAVCSWERFCTFELGFAHGCDKPTILLNRTGSLGDAARLPFDLSMKQRLEYQTVEASLVERLKDALAKLPSRRG